MTTQRHNPRECWCGINHALQPMDAYDAAQEMFLAGRDQDDIEMYLVKTYPDLNAKGLVPTILRKAARDLVEL